MSHNRQGFISWFVRQALDDEEITLYGDGEQQRDMTYVDDAVDAFLRAGAMDEANGRPFNLGGPRPYSLREIAETIVRLTGRGSLRLVPWPPEKKVIDVGSVYSSYDRIERELGWRPTVGLEEGLGRMIHYYRAHRDHYWERPGEHPVQPAQAAARGAQG
jgi:UDP-glucose 4-epimerase